MTSNSSDINPEQMKRELLHSNLPELAEGGFIEWNSDTQTVQRGENFDDLIHVLEQIERPDEYP